ncbi:uncharacterized protein UV8b_00346 [Ustilaginoidea virens]|uniref:Uncharacterized protein n=1 Tax=Ustilaginoidea virens TaxID=1159556 RepID=A0A8E5HIL2_USTVR|nr:uncharacterized protein UV8b_00346 [Ustilaginoidea virens]QUC16105.1 hypothetical protein UV8b_00346 [Ustilaginoidea virens]
MKSIYLRCQKLSEGRLSPLGLLAEPSGNIGFTGLRLDRMCHHWHYTAGTPSSYNGVDLFQGNDYLRSLFEGRFSPLGLLAEPSGSIGDTGLRLDRTCHHWHYKNRHPELL